MNFSKASWLGAAAVMAVSTMFPLTGAVARAQQDDPAAVHKKALVLDAHADMFAADGSKSGLSIDTGSQVDVAKLKAGKVDAIVLAVFEPTGPRTREAEAVSHAAALSKLQAIKDIAAQHPADVAIAYSAADVRRIAAGGRTAILIGFLNAYTLERDVRNVEQLQKRGVRIFGLAHAGNNAFADSSRPTSSDQKDENGGLSDLGRKAVAEANRLGLLIDVSQLTPAGVNQTLALSKAPVIASHSGVRSIVDNSRNLTDDQIRAIARGGGVVGLVAFPAYLHPLTDRDKAAIAEIGKRYGGNPLEGGELSPDQTVSFFKDVGNLIRGETTVAALVDQVDHVVRLVGIDHVAISSDFNHGGGIVGWQNEGEAANVTAELLRRGYSATDIEKIWSGNVLRALDAAQNAARQ